ncbi:MAG: tetratricopeptide repeat protein, partial [Paracoccaceae bacterium]
MTLLGKSRFGMRCAGLLISFALFSLGSLPVAAQSVTGLVSELVTSALQARQAGDYKTAIADLRRALRRTPANQRIRQELGYTLILDEQFAAAQYHFEILHRSATAPTDRRLYTQVLRRLAQDRPFGLGAVFSITPSSNLNGGSRHTTFSNILGSGQINQESQAQSGYERQIGLNGFARKPFEGNHNLRLGWEVLRTDTTVDSIPRTDQAALHLSWQTQWPKFRLTRTLSHTRITTDTDRQSQNTLGLTGRHRMTPKTDWTWAAAITEKSYATAPDRDGTYYWTHLRRTQRLPRSQNIWIGGQIEVENTGRAHQAYSGAVVQIGGQKRFEGGTIANLVYSHGIR